jgi:hypothetical protein
MPEYLRRCVIESSELRIPRSHLPHLVAFFDGTPGGDRAGVRAVDDGAELCLEGEGGRLVLESRGAFYVGTEIDVSEDRAGDFFGRVVVNLFLTYGGTLRCRVRWDGQDLGASAEGTPVVVEAGKTDWDRELSRGAWLPPEVAAELELALFGGAVNAGEEAVAPLPDDVREKLEEARRHFATYLALKTARETEELKR